MGCYSLPIVEPRTRKDGLLNFVQMIINAAERGDVSEAVLLAVDLKDTLAGNANPFASLTDGFTREAIVKEVADARRLAELDVAQRITAAREEGRRQARAEILRSLAEEVV